MPTTMFGQDTGDEIPPADCDAIVTAWKNTIMAGGEVRSHVPRLRRRRGNGQNGWFHIRGYATFRIIGWKFAGGGRSEVFGQTMPGVGVRQRLHRKLPRHHRAVREI